MIPGAVVLLGGWSAGCEEPEPEYRESPFVRPAERVELTEADLVDFDRAEIVTEVPWGTNTLNRLAVRDVGMAVVDSVQAIGYDEFDRVVLHFGAQLPAMPGYRVTMASAPTEVDCEAEPGTVRVVLVHPARHSGSEASGQDADEADSVGEGPRLEGVTELCPGSDGRVQAVHIAQASMHRVMELRDPVRLVVDVR